MFNVCNEVRVCDMYNYVMKGICVAILILMHYRSWNCSLFSAPELHWLYDKTATNWQYISPIHCFVFCCCFLLFCFIFNNYCNVTYHNNFHGVKLSHKFCGFKEEVKVYLIPCSFAALSQFTTPAERTLHELIFEIWVKNRESYSS